MAIKLLQEIEFTQNGVTIKNRETLQKVNSHNSSMAGDNIQLFLYHQLKNFEPGEVYQIETIITKITSKKPV